MASQRRARKDKKDPGAAGTFTNPDKDNLPEERIVQVFERVVQGIVKQPPPTAAGVPQAIMETLCRLHPRYKDWAEYRALKAEEIRLTEELEFLKNKKPDGRRKGRKTNAAESAEGAAAATAPSAAEG
eukprot:TRINITY_DN19606_c0_g1_i1.p1 TRINITY_DN19606_c0_g1~~TRINITY_DN19606_c0_g1_i1.p1  ORF type:complete len:128 (-),score=32.44 TRINITY_DN19606_c0_g1_i1:23-406(-)